MTATYTDVWRGYRVTRAALVMQRAHAAGIGQCASTALLVSLVRQYNISAHELLTEMEATQCDS